MQVATEISVRRKLPGKLPCRCRIPQHTQLRLSRCLVHHCRHSRQCPRRQRSRTSQRQLRSSCLCTPRRRPSLLRLSKRSTQCRCTRLRQQNRLCLRKLSISSRRTRSRQQSHLLPSQWLTNFLYIRHRRPNLSHLNSSPCRCQHWDRRLPNRLFPSHKPYNCRRLLQRTRRQ